MNKMVKGTIAIGAGALLLLGGGGTLAAWNADQTAQMGTIQAGNLNLTTVASSWESSLKPGVAINIDSYRIIPGETLTFEQKMNVALEGNQLSATLELVDGETASSFAEDTISVSEISLKDKNGNPLDGSKLVGGFSQQVTATVKFAFKSEVTDQQSANATYDFGNAAFMLAQQALPAGQ